MVKPDEILYSSMKGESNFDDIQLVIRLHHLSRNEDRRIHPNQTGPVATAIDRDRAHCQRWSFQVNRQQ